MEQFKNLQSNGRQLGSLVRIMPLSFWMDNNRIDFTDYTNPRIYAIIPCWMDNEGNMTSLRTGKPVKKLSGLDQFRPEGFGDAYDYDDGVKIIYTRRWPQGSKKPEYFFAKRECRDCECVHHRAFGEEITSIPETKK